MSETITCPACGGINPGDSVFCAGPTCRKALGEFRFVREEFAAVSRWYERVADRVTTFVGTPHFLAAHAVWFLAWVAINTGIVAVMARFDEYPFGLLGIILAIEAIFITGIVLISNNRQSAHADLRGELDYEVNVHTYRRIQEIERLLQTILERLDAAERTPAGDRTR